MVVQRQCLHGAHVPNQIQCCRRGSCQFHLSSTRRRSCGVPSLRCPAKYKDGKGPYLRKVCQIDPGLLIYVRPALQKNLVTFFSVFAWEFCIEKRSTKTPQIIQENLEQNSGQNSTKTCKIRGTFVLQLF